MSTLSNPKALAPNGLYLPQQDFTERIGFGKRIHLREVVAAHEEVYLLPEVCHLELPQLHEYWKPGKGVVHTRGVETVTD